VRVELGLVRRAPRGWRRLGLEWLWRLRQEPGRLWRRYLGAMVWFPVAMLRDSQARKKDVLFLKKEPKKLLSSGTRLSPPAESEG
jgi:N-acetylglucosaminyldiphosphoundecaprenol N-acetyl-beta-D-mannosaminyltransferase